MNEFDSYVKYQYGVPDDIGRIVYYRERRGIICEIGGCYVNINFDDRKPGHVEYVHPTDPNIKYMEEVGKIREMTRSQERYKRYLMSETSDSFMDWLKYEK